MRHILLLTLGGCFPLLTGCTADPALGQSRQRPRIDVEAPRQIETVTFALG